MYAIVLTGVSTSSVSGMVLVPLMYCIVRANFFQSSVLGSRTQVRMSGLVLLLKYSNFAVSE